VSRKSNDTIHLTYFVQSLEEDFWEPPIFLRIFQHVEPQLETTSFLAGTTFIIPPVAANVGSPTDSFDTTYCTKKQ
jgi:hypothetical protein